MKLYTLQPAQADEGEEGYTYSEPIFWSLHKNGEKYCKCWI